MTVGIKDKGRFEVRQKKRVGVFWIPYSWIYLYQHRAILLKDWAICSLVHALISWFLSSRWIQQFLGDTDGPLETLRRSWAFWPLYLFLYIRVQGNWVLRATQNHLIVSIVMRKVRQYWRKRVSTLVERTEGPGYVSLRRCPPSRSKDIFEDVWNSVEVLRGSSFWLNITLTLMSLPLNALPYIGPYVYFWLHSGLRAQRMCSHVADSEKTWTTGFRAIWRRHHWRRVQVLACAMEVTEIIPWIGEPLTLVNDVATMLWAAGVKTQLRLEELTLEDVRPKLNISSPSTTESGDSL